VDFAAAESPKWFVMAARWAEWIHRGKKVAEDPDGSGVVWPERRHGVW